MRVLSTIICFIIFSTLVMAEVPEISVNGHVLGGLNVIKQKNRTTKGGKQNQFDFATNVDFGFRLSDSIEGLVQVQGSPGTGSLGYPGPGFEVTDLNIMYNVPNKPFVLTMGSFDMPFGLNVSRLTNNADTFQNDLIINDLMYSAFAGPVGTLNTLGVKADYSHDLVDMTVVVSNGTDESAQNNDEGFASLVSLSTASVIPYSRVGVTMMRADERLSQEALPEDGPTHFNADFTGAILDWQLFIVQDLSVSLYGAMLEYGDRDSTTKDKVTVLMIDAKKTFSDFFVVARISSWKPDDNDASGTGISDAIPNPGFAIAQAGVNPVTDQEVRRYELGVGYNVDESVLLKSQVFIDDYKQESNNQNTDLIGGLAVINVRF